MRIGFLPAIGQYYTTNIAISYYHAIDFITTTREQDMNKVNIAEQMATITDHWQPLIVAELNGQHLKMAKLKGEFIMHHHDAEDEMFLVVRGRLVIVFENRRITLDPGEFLVIPRGVAHMPVAEQEVEILLFEPASTRNTGNIVNDRTVSDLKTILP